MLFRKPECNHGDYIQLTFPTDISRRYITQGAAFHIPYTRKCIIDTL